MSSEGTTQDGQLRAGERRDLSLELHDVVSHHLANVSLLAMGHLQSTDADELRTVLRRVGRSTDLALRELRLLVRILRDDPATAPGFDQLGGLAGRLAPTAVAIMWRDRLTEAGFAPTVKVPGDADHLGLTVQATITRTLDVTGRNILRHAPAGSRCTITVRISPTQVDLRVVSRLSPRPQPPSSGRQLRALGERVRLSGGQLRAGAWGSDPDDAQWIVELTLPYD